MCANLEIPSLGWKWESILPSIHVYCKILWETKYKKDYELICNGLFPTLYQVLFGEEAPCLSPEGEKDSERIWRLVYDTSQSLYQNCW